MVPPGELIHFYSDSEDKFFADINSPHVSIKNAKLYNIKNYEGALKTIELCHLNRQ